MIDANEAAIEAGVATGVVFSPGHAEALAAKPSAGRCRALCAAEKGLAKNAAPGHEVRGLLGYAAPSNTPISTRLAGGNEKSR